LNKRTVLDACYAHNFLDLNQETTTTTTISKAATAMKIYSNFLALCVFQTNVWGTTAFFVQAPKTLHVKALHSSAAPAPTNKKAEMPGEKTWDTMAPPLVIQGGGALRTWPIQSAEIERVLVHLTSIDEHSKEGRLLNALLYMGIGPDNTPMEMTIYSGKGKYRPFKAVIETPGNGSTLFIRNIAPIEFPMNAHVAPAGSEGVVIGSGTATGKALTISKSMYNVSAPRMLQGNNAVMTFPLEASVSSVKVILKTNGRPLNAMIELNQSPNSPKHTVKLHTQNGLDRPFFMVIDTPGAGNVVRIVNTATAAFPLTVSVEPYLVAEPSAGKQSGGSGWNVGGSMDSLPVRQR
jgi:hypothetical protein